ncbi:unnamed protein product [Vitrella brassicaformis CCMP3155]|uniref:Uncharacterized protein n=3 Tax=Vitrella brassicaformis TaxID=1169539 RepID=A0A0G4EKW8_VITBC|nr:unnamed protein product [Vitrella brassicaformis CCMP3155]|eukprot:CEL97528.1 unnamed protein product [Vitrella brassicaformis CCMP3155]
MEEIWAATDRNGFLRIDIHSGAILGNFKDSINRGSCVSRVGQSSCYFAAAQAGKALLHVWQFSRDTPCYRISLPEVMTALTFSADAHLCFAGAQSGMMYVWQVASGCLLRAWRGHGGAVTFTGLTSDDAALITAASDGHLHVYLLPELFQPSGGTRAAGASLGEGYDPATQHKLWTSHTQAVTAVSVSGGGLEGFVASASADRTVRLWRLGGDMRGGRVEAMGSESSIAAILFPAVVNALAVSPANDDVFCGAANGEVYALSASRMRQAGGPLDRRKPGSGLLTVESGKGEWQRSFIGHQGPVAGVSVNVDGSRLVSCAGDGLRIWDIPTRQTLRHLPNLDSPLVAVFAWRRTSGEAPLPPMQPFTRSLTSFEAVPPVVALTAGRLRRLYEKAADIGISTRRAEDGVEALCRALATRNAPGSHHPPHPSTAAAAAASAGSTSPPSDWQAALEDLAKRMAYANALDVARERQRHARTHTGREDDGDEGGASMGPREVPLLPPVSARRRGVKRESDEGQEDDGTGGRQTGENDADDDDDVMIVGSKGPSDQPQDDDIEEGGAGRASRKQRKLEGGDGAVDGDRDERARRVSRLAQLCQAKKGPHE